MSHDLFTKGHSFTLIALTDVSAYFLLYSKCAPSVKFFLLRELGPGAVATSPNLQKNVFAEPLQTPPLPLNRQLTEAPSASGTDAGENSPGAAAAAETGVPDDTPEGMEGAQRPSAVPRRVGRGFRMSSICWD